MDHLAMQQDNIMSSLRGPIAGMDGILISTAIDETGNDMSDTQSMPHGDEPRILLHPFSFLGHGTCRSIRRGYPNGFQSVRLSLLDLNGSETSRCDLGHSEMIILWYDFNAASTPTSVLPDFEFRGLVDA
ncbi:hypothetical protein MES4922_120007 [Mesorhizobium ventifaucium]|uniref:Uncharacterized protein n=1 Tax=Mesorhizobium ventifaucium TaxID=666020 RepID=A0ABN8JAU0_9HYPH|nr:hypothetical protein MES4922_120007 [Mesorhizobium ventifaucium]